MNTDFQKHRKMIASMLNALDGVQEAEQQTRELQQAKISLEREVSALKTGRDDLARLHQAAQEGLEKQTGALKEELARLRKELTTTKAEKMGILGDLEARIVETKADLDNLSRIRDSLRNQLHGVAGVGG